MTTHGVRAIEESFTAARCCSISRRKRPQHAIVAASRVCDGMFHRDIDGLRQLVGIEPPDLGNLLSPRMYRCATSDLREENVRLKPSISDEAEERQQARGTGLDTELLAEFAHRRFLWQLT